MRVLTPLLPALASGAPGPDLREAEVRAPQPEQIGRAPHDHPQVLAERSAPGRDGVLREGPGQVVRVDEVRPTAGHCAASSDTA